MTKFDKEFISQIEEAVKFIENTTCDDPGPSIEYQDMRHKNIKKYLEKLIKKNNESKD
jgi:hypothetical protein